LGGPRFQKVAKPQSTSGYQQVAEINGISNRMLLKQRVRAGQMQKEHNKRLKRTNIRCHLFCTDTQKSRHQTFARLAGRYL